MHHAWKSLRLGLRIENKNKVYKKKKIEIALGNCVTLHCKEGLECSNLNLDSTYGVALL